MYLCLEVAVMTMQSRLWLHSILSPDQGLKLQVSLKYWFNNSMAVHDCSNATHSKQEADASRKEPTTCCSSLPPLIFCASNGKRRLSTCLVHPGASPPLTVCYFKHMTHFQGAIQIKKKKDKKMNARDVLRYGLQHVPTASDLAILT